MKILEITIKCFVFEPKKVQSCKITCWMRIPQDESSDYHLDLEGLNDELSWSKLDFDDKELAIKDLVENVPLQLEIIRIELERSESDGV